MLEVVILWEIHLIKCVSQVKQKIKTKFFQHGYRNQWIENIKKASFMPIKWWNLMEQNVIQINGGIMINVSVSVKKFMYVKKIMFGILTDIIVEMENV